MGSVRGYSAAGERSQFARENKRQRFVLIPSEARGSLRICWSVATYFKKDSQLRYIRVEQGEVFAWFVFPTALTERRHQFIRHALRKGQTDPNTRVRYKTCYSGEGQWIM